MTTRPFKKNTFDPKPAAPAAPAAASVRRGTPRKGDLRKARAAAAKSAAAKKSDVDKTLAREARHLSGAATRHLRGLGHHLDPIVQLGKEGISDGIVAATREALLAHELVKVKVLAECPIGRKEAGPELAERTGSALAQTLGRTLLLYKRHPNKPKIVLPR